MPIYEYGCESCGHVLEVWAKIDDAPPATCPNCGHANPKKLISRTAFHLKGGGWYAQGYGSSGSGSGSGSGSSASSDSSSASSSSTSSATPSTTPTSTTGGSGSSGSSTP